MVLQTLPIQPQIPLPGPDSDDDHSDSNNDSSVASLLIRSIKPLTSVCIGHLSPQFLLAGAAASGAFAVLNDCETYAGLSTTFWLLRCEGSPKAATLQIADSRLLVDR